jgi:hypothetical protein
VFSKLCDEFADVQLWTTANAIKTSEGVLGKTYSKLTNPKVILLLAAITFDQEAQSRAVAKKGVFTCVRVSRDEASLESVA